MKKSTGKQDDGSHSSTTVHIPSGDNSQANTLMEYDNDETLEIKEEIMLEQERQESGDHNLFPDKNHLGEKSISFDNNSGARILTEYENEGTLEIKQEILQDQEIHQSGDHNLLSDQNHREEKSAFYDNNSGCRTLIEYDDDETLEIKEEMVKVSDRENTGKIYNKKYELKFCTVDISADDIFAAKNLQCSTMKQKIPDSKQDKKRTSKTSQPRHNCAKFSRSYVTKGGFMQHECLEHSEAKPQFVCNVCGYKTNRKDVFSKHISISSFSSVHLERNLFLI